MPPHLSLYLDVLRFGAATLVLITHASYERFGGSWLVPIGQFGHEAVVVFFVLSGFVIRYVATRERTPAQYAVSRAARLYSVVLPALIGTVLADFIGRSIAPAMYDTAIAPDNHPVVRFAANALFLNEIWFWSIRPFSNGPFWSLGYEAWYYIIFGIMFFGRGANRVLLSVLAGVAMGPKILILLPVWLLGVAAFQIAAGGRVGERLGLALILGSIAGAGLTIACRSAIALPADVAAPLSWSRDFPADYVLGLCIAANIMGFWAFGARLARPLELAAAPIRYLAGLTFPLYLCHFPLLMLFGAAFVRDRTATENIMVIVATLACVCAAAPFMERQRLRLKALLGDASRLRHPSSDAQRSAVKTLMPSPTSSLSPTTSLRSQSAESP
jgi:peptidoglycan/LPS O-acetylase OafA/YrhL